VTGPRPAAPRGAFVRGWLLAHVVVALAIFALGVAAFAVHAGGLENRFALVAREEYRGRIALSQISLLPAYLLVALVHFALTLAPARALAIRWRLDRSATRRLAVAAILTPPAAIVALGAISNVHVGALDTLARLAASSFEIDLYRVFIDFRLREALGLVAICSLGASLFPFVHALYVRFHATTRLRRGAIAASLTLPFALLAIERLPEDAEASRSPSRPHLIVIASDSLRADHLGVRGYPRNVSPSIDAFASEAIDFENAYVATASTLESWATFLTGRWPANHGLRYMFVSRDQAASLGSDPATLPRAMRRLGYRTAVAGDWAANCFDVIDFGFDRRYVSRVQNLAVFLSEIAFKTHPLVPLYAGALGLEALARDLRQATALLAPHRIVDDFMGDFERSADSGQPYFGVLFLSATHLPYLTPHPFNRKFVDPSYRGRNRFHVDFDVDAFIQRGFAEAQSEAERRHVIDLYDGAVAWFDAIVGDVLRRLRESGHLEDTIVVITSDHGDDLYEPGTTLGHGTTFAGGDQANRIPFLMRLPGARHAGVRVTSIVRNVDFMPTLLELVGAPPAELRHTDGVSLLPLLEPDENGAERDLALAAYAETCYLFFPKRGAPEGALVLRPADETLYIDREFDEQFVLADRWHDDVIAAKDRMLRTSRHKLVWIPTADPEAPILRLYDMELDPHQLRDVALEHPQRLATMRAALAEWIATGRDRRLPRDP
jgi:arylsulfatase A-like enzyme